ncbi:MAG: sulfite exporter TauE/SafE family protein [Nitrosarchaeum sp.]
MSFEEALFYIGTFVPTLMLGLVIGIQHAFEPDHMAAVGTQLFKNKSKNGINDIIKSTFTKSSIIGVFWGAGHTTTLVVIGLLSFFFTISIHDEIFSAFELLVGIMLIFLGITTVWKKKFTFAHRHPHQHSDGNLHFDAHDHNDSNHNHAHKSYLIGMIHGLAGSGSLVVLAAATLDSMEMTLTFILLFGIGSIIGMMLVSGLIGLPILLANRVSSINRVFRYVTAVISFIIGAKILFEIGMLNIPLHL